MAGAFRIIDWVVRVKLAALAARLTAGDRGAARFDGCTITLHWLTVLLVVLLFVLAESWGFAGHATRTEMITAHMSLGIVLAVVLVGRIAWRLGPGHRQPTTGLVELTSQAVQYLLYFLLATQAVLGFVFRWSGNEAMSFFGILIPPPFPPFPQPSHRLVGDAHYWAGWAIILLAGGHATAALFHEFVLRDDVLARMMPRSLRSLPRPGPDNPTNRGQFIN